MKKVWSVSRLLAGLCLACSLWASDASAQAVFSADGGFAMPVNASYASYGGNFSARIGRRIGIRSLWETPELVFNYAMFGSGEENGYPDGFEAMRGLIGARLTFGGILRPGLLAHLGLGRIAGAIDSRGENNALQRRDITHTAFTWDAGLTFDLAISRNFELGVHGTYSHILGPGSRVAFRWFDIGGHLAIIL